MSRSTDQSTIRVEKQYNDSARSESGNGLPNLIPVESELEFGVIYGSEIIFAQATIYVARSGRVWYFPIPPQDVSSFGKSSRLMRPCELLMHALIHGNRGVCVKFTAVCAELGFRLVGLFGRSMI
jgi:hypothetical protein